MATFTQRTTAPSTSDQHYYSENPFYLAGYGLPNCTAYAWGRFYELSGTRPTLSTGDAEDWYNYADGYKRGKTPKLGAVIVWAKGAIGDDSDGAGHVAIVEQINSDGSIVTSNSAWNSTLFYRQNIPSTYALSGYTFQGFIYNPVDFSGGGSTEPVPTPIGGNRYLSQSEMENNAKYIWWWFSKRGWTLNACAAMLGNMQAESTINPGIWQNLDEGNTALGFGLVQWTPATKLINWAAEYGHTYTEMDTQLLRINYEAASGIQWLQTTAYPITFNDFVHSTASVGYLARAFLLNYERPADQSETVQEYRVTLAEYWYTFLSNVNINPSTKRKRRRKYNFVLFGKKQWR